MEKRIIHFPLKTLLSFLIFSEFLIWFGPINYEIKNSFILVLYLFIVNLAFYFGYCQGVKRFKPSKFHVSSVLIKSVIILGFILNCFNLGSMWQSHGLSVSIDTFMKALLDPGQAYISSSDAEITSNMLLLLMSPIQWSALPFGIFYWDKANKFYKSITLLTLFVILCSWLGIGVRKGLFDVILVVSVCALAINPSYLLDAKKNKRVKISLLVFSCLFVSYFLFSNLSRYGESDFSALIYLNNGTYREVYLEYLPTVFVVVISMIASYLTQGYYALAKGLEMGIMPVSFMGSSWFTIAIAKKFSFDPTPNTYMALLEPQGIQMTVNWHSIYLWLANDFTFLGVPIVIYFIGYFFAQSWCDSLHRKNILALPVLALFSVMVFYFFANNQVISFSFIPFVVCFSAYILSRKV